MENYAAIKKLTSIIYNNINETLRYYVGRKKPDTKEYIKALMV